MTRFCASFGSASCEIIESPIGEHAEKVEEMSVLLTDRYGRFPAIGSKL